MNLVISSALARTNRLIFSKCLAHYYFSWHAQQKLERWDLSMIDNAHPMLKKLVLLAFIFLTFPVLANDVQEGKSAPAFEATTLEGTKFSLSEQIGKVVIVHYWATWCSSCREEMPAFEKYYKAHQQEGLTILAVSLDEPEDLPKVKDVMKSYSFPAAMATDAKARAYGRIWRIPLTFVIDRQGVLRRNGWYGEANIDQATLEKTITPLLK